MIPDWDIAVRRLGGKGQSTKVRDVMKPEINYCFADQETDETSIIAALGPREHQRRDHSHRTFGLPHAPCRFGKLTGGDATAPHDWHTPSIWNHPAFSTRS
jgi:hypothetical protein